MYHFRLTVQASIHYIASSLYSILLPNTHHKCLTCPRTPSSSLWWAISAHFFPVVPTHSSNFLKTHPIVEGYLPAPGNEHASTHPLKRIPFLFTCVQEENPQCCYFPGRIILWHFFLFSANNVNTHSVWFHESIVTLKMRLLYLDRCGCP